MRRAILATTVISLLAASTSQAAVRRVKSGVVSLSLSEDFIAGLAIVEIDSPAEPAEGFDLGLLVLDGSTFAINVGDGEFAGFRDGRLDLAGGISYSTPPPSLVVEFTDFSIIWDSEHEPEEFHLFGRFRISPVFDLLVSLGDFAVGDISYDDGNGALTVPEFEIVASMDFAEALGFPPLAGTPLGRARMDLSMATPNGDADDDTDVDLDDYASYAGCVSGPSGGLSSNLCATFDFDDDGDVDLPDFSQMQEVFTGLLYTLDTRSEGTAGVAVDVTPADYFGEGGGITPFRNSYEPGVTVTLTAPPATLLEDFVRWRVEDSDLPEGENEIEITMEAATVATATYVSVTSELHITSQGAAAVPIGVSEVDVYGEADGVTDFVRVYPDGTEVALTAPAAADDRFFRHWQVDGAPGASGDLVASVVVADDVTAAAVYSYIVIQEQPQSVGTCVGLPFSLSVSALGSDLEYQWRKNGAVLDGEVSATLTVAAAALGDTGTYRVEVSNANASVTSAGAMVTVVDDSPTITVQPNGSNVCPGNSVFMFTIANGGTLFYQWFKDEVAIDGATTAFFSISPAGTSDSGTYTVEVSNQCGSVVSNEAIVEVDEVHCP